MLSPPSAARSRNMSRIKGKNTKPELIVRRMIFRCGFRYRLHDSKLPGTPDLIFSKMRKLIFVNGCFWHLHQGCRFSKLPKTNQDFWKKKLEGNRARDRMNQEGLETLGWKVLVIWECELNEPDLVKDKILHFLSA